MGTECDLEPELPQEPSSCPVGSRSLPKNRAGFFPLIQGLLSCDQQKGALVPATPGATLESYLRVSGELCPSSGLLMGVGVGWSGGWWGWGFRSSPFLQL